MILHILSAEICGPHSLSIIFNDGTHKQVDLLPLLEGPIFEPLKDPVYFARFIVDPILRTVSWPNGADFAPEALYNLGNQNDNKIKKYSEYYAEYARMRETGFLSEDDRVELIDGEVRDMRPISPIHAAIVKRLNALLSRVLSDTVILSIQDPIHLHDYSEPQPDLAILQYRSDFYAQAHPVADDVLLVIEVADTSIDYDRDEKLPRYAQANIAEVWLIDVNNLTIEQYVQPRNGKYLVKQLAERGDTLTSQTIPNLSFDVDHVFE